jgi:hypothetical protein
LIAPGAAVTAGGRGVAVAVGTGAGGFVAAVVAAVVAAGAVVGAVVATGALVGSATLVGSGALVGGAAVGAGVGAGAHAAKATSTTKVSKNINLVFILFLLLLKRMGHYSARVIARSGLCDEAISLLRFGDCFAWLAMTPEYLRELVCLNQAHEFDLRNHLLIRTD